MVSLKVCVVCVCVVKVAGAIISFSVTQLTLAAHLFAAGLKFVFAFENVFPLNTRELQFESVLHNCGAWSLFVVACCSVPASADVVCVRRGRSGGAPSVRAERMAASSSKK